MGMKVHFRQMIATGAIAGIALLAGCGSNSINKPTGTGVPPVTPTTITLSLTGPAVATIGTPVQYTASVAGTTNLSVTWTVNQITGGNAQVGTISTAGLYTPPAAMPASPTVTVAAASVADTSVSQSLAVTIQAASGATPTSVTVTGPSTVNIGTTSQFTVAVAGSQDPSVTWAVNGTAGGNATFGTISASGLYTPPATIPSTNSLVISAASAVSASVSGSFNTTLLEPVPVITAAVGSTQDSGQTFLVDVEGAAFISGATIFIGGQSVTTNAVGPEDLQTTVSNPGGQPMQISLTVQNPNPGETQSTAVTVSLTLPLSTPTAAARFLDQASFGPTAATIAHVQQIGLQAALTEQFNQPTTLYSAPTSSNADCSGQSIQCTQSEFLSVALFGNDQLRQRVAMALSELWVAPNPADGAQPYYLNILANDAFTNYRTIMQDATLTPSMGAYLNMVNSAKAPAGQIANENYAREIMQLFTIGLNMLNSDGTMQTDSGGNPIPTYTESQVQALARAFTGWTYANPDGSAPTTYFNYTRNWANPMVAVDFQHDTTSKTLLNGTTLPAGQTTEQDLTGALDNIFAHPNIGPFVCKQLIQHLVEGDPSPAYVQRIAAVFANNGSGVRGDMKAVLTAILMDPEARAGDTQTGDQADSNPAMPNGGHLREPLLWTTNVLRGINATQTNRSDLYPFVSLMSGRLNYVGEAPFGEPNVFNFFSPQYMIPLTTINSPEFGIENTATVPLMLSLANYLLHNQAPGLNLDLSAGGAIGQMAGNPSQMVDYLGMVFMHSQMPTDMRNALIASVSSIPQNVPQTRAIIAVYLIITSAEYKIIH